MNKEKLLALLRALPDLAFESGFDFTQSVIPQLIALLGFHESQTFYEYGRTLADVVIADSIMAKPWIVIEVKNSKNFDTNKGINQVYGHMLATECERGVLLSPELIVLIYEKGVLQFHLQTLDVNSVNSILAILSRSAQESREESNEPIGQLVELIEAVEQASTNDEKGKTLEALAKVVFDSVPGLRCKYANLQTRSSEIDLVIEYNRSVGYLPLFEERGRYCLVECKNWSKPVDVKPVRDFIGKLEKCKARLGVIFSKNGITGADTGLDARREIHSLFDRSNIYLLVFSIEELKYITNGIEFYQALDRKADYLLFDSMISSD